MALAVYELIEANDFFSIEGLNEESIKFSVLSTGLADERISRFAGVSTKIDENTVAAHPIIDPSSLSTEGIKDLTKWMFERDDKGQTVLGESRRLRELAAIVDSSKALKALREGADLSQAFRKTQAIDADFIGYMYQAESELGEAMKISPHVAFDDDAYETLSRIVSLVKALRNTLNQKREELSDDL